MTDPISLLSSSDSSSSDDDSLVVLPAKKKAKASVASSVKSSSDDSDFDIPMESIFSKPTVAKPRPRVARIDTPTSDDDDSSAHVDSLAAKCLRPKPLKSPDKVLDRHLATTERRRLKELELQRRKKEKEVIREKERLERESRRSSLKQDKLNRKLAAQQISGKFAKDEVGLLLHPALKQHWSDESWTALVETCPNVLETERGDERAIHFLRSDYLAGGAKAAIKAFQDGNADGYQLVDRLLIVFSDPDDFLRLLDRSELEDDYPRLEEWLEEIYASWRNNWTASTTPKIVVLLPDIIDTIRRHWNAASQAQRWLLVTEGDINDAIVWLQVAFCVECQILKAESQVVEFVRDLARAISEQPYAQQVTELDCVRKLKCAVPATAPPLARAQDAWIRMLQQIPGMSAARAEQLAQYYPTARSLWQAYQKRAAATTSGTLQGEDNDCAKEHMVAHLFGERGHRKKLSEQIFKTMTCANRNELLL